MKIPILKLKNILLTSVQIDLTDDEALEFQNDVLDNIVKYEAKGIVIDVTALDVVDSFMARVLNDTASMARLIGAEALVTGMRPAVALTLVEMGRQLLGVRTALNLEIGLEMLQKDINAKGNAIKKSNIKDKAIQKQCKRYST